MGLQMDKNKPPRVCHYDVQHHGSRSVEASFSIHMKSRSARPKWRNVCVECCHRMTRDALIDRIVDVVFGFDTDGNIIDV